VKNDDADEAEKGRILLCSVSAELYPAVLLSIPSNRSSHRPGV